MSSVLKLVDNYSLVSLETPSMLHLTDWDDEAAALASRAATYSSVRRKDKKLGESPEERISGWFRFKDLGLNPSAGKQKGLRTVNRFELRNETQLRAWWWVHLPILKELLIDTPRVSSSALAVILGRHEGVMTNLAPGTATLEDTRYSIQRDWIHFFSRDFDIEPVANCPEKLDRLLRFCLISSFHSLNDPSTFRPPMLTTSLLERLFDLERYPEKLRVPLICPLVVNFTAPEHDEFFPNCTRSENLQNKYIRVANWWQIREEIRRITELLKETSRDRFYVWLETNREELNQVLQSKFNECPEPMWKEPPVHVFSEQDLGEKFKDFILFYEQSLDDRFKRLKENLGLSVLQDLVLGQAKNKEGEDDRKSLAYWFDQQVSPCPNYEELVEGLVKGNILLYDLGAGDHFSHLITVPAWIPPESPGLQSNSIVVYVRPGKWLGYQVPDEEQEPNRIKRLLDFSAAVRSASLSISERSGLAGGAARRGEAESQRLGHEMSNVLANAISLVPLASYENYAELAQEVIESSLEYALILVSSTGQYTPKEGSPWSEDGQGKAVQAYLEFLLSYAWKIAVRRRIGALMDIRWLEKYQDRFIRLLNQYPQQRVTLRQRLSANKCIDQLNHLKFVEFHKTKRPEDFAATASNLFQFLVPALHNAFRHGAPETINDSSLTTMEQIVSVWETYDQFQQIVIEVEAHNNTSSFTIYNASDRNDSKIGSQREGTGLVLQLASKRLIRDFVEDDFQWRRMTKEEIQQVFLDGSYTECCWKTQLRLRNTRLFKPLSIEH